MKVEVGCKLLAGGSYRPRDPHKSSLYSACRNFHKTDFHSVLSLSQTKAAIRLSFEAGSGEGWSSSSRAHLVDFKNHCKIREI